MKEYNKSNIPRAKTLRKNMTPWERKLWYEFLRSYPIRWQRQKSIGDYIVDFYCARAELAIEVDGSGHYTDEQLAKDAIRTMDLGFSNITVIRITNREIGKNFNDVCDYIDNVTQRILISKKRDSGISPSVC